MKLNIYASQKARKKVKQTLLFQLKKLNILNVNSVLKLHKQKHVTKFNDHSVLFFLTKESILFKQTTAKFLKKRLFSVFHT